MKKILLLFVLFLGFSFWAFSASEVEVASDAPVLKIFYNSNGAIDVVDDHSPCITQYEENSEGGYDVIHKNCH